MVFAGKQIATPPYITIRTTILTTSNSQLRRPFLAHRPHRKSRSPSSTLSRPRRRRRSRLDWLRCEAPQIRRPCSHRAWSPLRRLLRMLQRPLQSMSRCEVLGRAALHWQHASLPCSPCELSAQNARQSDIRRWCTSGTAQCGIARF